MFCVAICDDDELLCSQLEGMLEPYRKRGLIRSEIFYSGEKLCEALDSGKHYDLLFLDIELCVMNGIDVGKKIRDVLDNERIHIIYISAKQEYAMELFSVRPMNFLIKPISAKTIIDNLEKAMALSEMYDSYFEFKFGKEFFRVAYGDILYFESYNRKVLIHTKTEVKEMYGKLKTVEKQVPPNFVRIHQSYLVNRSYIAYWKYEEIRLTNKQILPISQAYRKNVNEFLLQNIK